MTDKNSEKCECIEFKGQLSGVVDVSHCPVHGKDPHPSESWEIGFRKKFIDGVYKPVDGRLAELERVIEYVRQTIQEEREKMKDMVLDIIQETDWIEEPKSAFGKLNKILQVLNDK
jgi:hypothetical protein